ncbi:hypothetical protein LSTR_LSTR002511 [Laodelphax striatellus]|uniref:Uncharacterized protein n=1 Tax=Laodelphax striatellus TaxID=195883 RepID=A0A482X3K1_LAOST|nr:hypothetical protein LSTR_LSTR002511 [Laodelphax striatellus]
MPPRCPHLGHSQGSTKSLCNDKVSPWGNCLRDHGNPHARNAVKTALGNSQVDLSRRSGHFQTNLGL